MCHERLHLALINAADRSLVGEIRKVAAVLPDLYY